MPFPIAMLLIMISYVFSGWIMLDTHKEELALADSLMIDIEKCEAQLPRDQLCTYQVIPMERYNGKQDRKTESSS